MAFPTTSILDNFNRADGAIGGSWTAPMWTGDGTPQISTNQLTGAANVGNYYDAYWNASSFGPDTEAYVTIATRGNAGNADELYIDVRGTPGTVTSYQLDIAMGSPNDTWQVIKTVSGAGSTLGATYTSQNISAGDSVGIEVTGSSTVTINIYYKPSGGSWTLLFSRTDSTSPITAAGRISIGVKNNIYRLDDYGGGTIVAASGPFPLPGSNQMQNAVYRM